MNQVFVDGRLGRDPELRASQGGTSILNFAVANNERVKKQGEWQDETTWFRCTVFGKRADALNKILSKGDKVVVRGRLHVREYENRDGEQRKSVEIVADDVVLAGGKRGQSGGGGNDGPPDAWADDSDVPF